MIDMEKIKDKLHTYMIDLFRKRMKDIYDRYGKNKFSKKIINKRYGKNKR